MYINLSSHLDNINALNYYYRNGGFWGKKIIEAFQTGCRRGAGKGFLLRRLSNQGQSKTVRAVSQLRYDHRKQLHVKLCDQSDNLIEHQKFNGEQWKK